MKRKRGPLAHSAFRPEPAEPEEARASSGRRLWAEESEETDNSEEPAGDEKPQPASVFNFGWHTLHIASKARFAREVHFSGKQEHPKRPYDNTQRAACAAYSRKGDVYQQNGFSDQRLLQVLAKESCNCFPGGNSQRSIIIFVCFMICYYYTGLSLPQVNVTAQFPTRLPSLQGARKNCFSKFKPQNLKDFLKEFWALSKSDQDSLATCQSLEFVLILCVNCRGSP